MRWIVGIIAALLIVANTFVNVDFWTSLGDSMDVKIVAGAWAIGLSMAEFCFPVIAAYSININPITRGLTWAVAIVAMFLSIAVCTLTLTTYVEPKITTLQAAQVAQQKQQSNQRLQDAFITAQINAANVTTETINGYNKANKLTAGSVVALDKLEIINNRINNLLQLGKEPVQQTQKMAIPALQGVARVADRLGVSLSTFLICVFLAVALLIEFTALLSCFYFRALMSIKPKPSKRPTSDNVLQETKNNSFGNSPTPLAEDLLTNLPVDENNEIQKSLPNNLEPIRQKILTGNYGKQPAFRVIRNDNKGIRFNELQTLREWMITAGELRREDGNRVTLTHQLLEEIKH